MPKLSEILPHQSSKSWRRKSLTVAKKLEKLQDFRDWINQYLLKNLERFKQKFPAVRSFSSVRRILYLKKKTSSLPSITPGQSREVTKQNWLVVSTPSKNMSQNGNLPQLGVKIQKIFEVSPPSKTPPGLFLKLYM